MSSNTQNELKSAALYWASLDNVQIRILGAAVRDIARSGSNDEAVAYWLRQPGAVDWQGATPDVIRADLKGVGAWDADELADDDANRTRFLWLAAWQVAEDETPDCSEPSTPSGEVGPFANRWF